MKISLLAAGLLAICGTLRADFGYQIHVEAKGPDLLVAPPIATHLIKGNRVARMIKGRTRVINLDNETITEIDYVKKTYSSLSFAQLKEKLPHANGATAFQTSVKPGGTKQIGILTAREQRITMTAVSPTLAHIFLDCWTMTPPGFEEVQTFRLKLGAKLGYAFAVGLEEIAAMKPELLAGLDETAKVMMESDELPVETLIRMGGPSSGDLATTEDSSMKPGMVAETLSRLESLGRRRPSSGKEEADQTPGLLADITVELSGFAAGPADEGKFNPPGGFKELKPAEPKK